MRASRIALPVFVLLVLVCLSATSYGRTWNVPAEAATIQAGIDSASAGDTVLVACGTYYEYNLDMKADVCLRSETGQFDCATIDAQQMGRVIEFNNDGSGSILEGFTITGGSHSERGAGIRVYEYSSPTIRNCHIRDNLVTGWNARGVGIDCTTECSPIITGCVFSGNVTTEYGNSYGGGLMAYSWCNPIVTNCTFYGNDARFGSQVAATSYCAPQFNNCILANGIHGEATYCYSSSITMSCCNVYGNQGGDWVSCISGQDGIRDNFSADPVFCGAPGGDLRLRSDSPCMSAPGCGLVGALGSGCRKPNHWIVPVDAPTIQAAIDSAAAGDTVLVACGTYFEHDIALKSGVLLTSATGTWDCVTVDAERLSRAFEGTYLDSTTAVTGFTVKHGAGVDSGAGMYLGYADLAITNCRFDSCRAGMRGGGIDARHSAPTLTNCFFYADTADIGGGAYLGNATPVLTDCIFSENNALYCGGAVYLYFCTDFDINICSAELNSSPYGGAVHCSYSSGTFDRISLRANAASMYGGAIYVEGDGDITIANTLMFDNVAATAGSGLRCDDSQVDIVNTTFFGNATDAGGGCVYGVDATLSLDNSIIAFGGGGGAVQCAGGATILTCCDIYANADGDWVGCIAGQEALRDNMSYDPLFCNVDLYDFHLAPYSPCLTGPCGQIGALGIGVDCLSEPPMIASVTDVGNDQGRQARLKWRRSAYDAPGNEIDITGYTVFRRQDAHLAAPPGSKETVAVDTPAHADGGVLVLMAEGWDQVDYVLAYGDSIYQVVVPTLCDSTDEGICWSVFMVRATSSDPFTYFDSAPDSGYSVDNLAPAPPPGLTMTSETDLAWEDVPDADFDYYSVYGSALEHLDETATLIGYTIDTAQDVAGHVYDYYHVTATDFSGNEGDESSVGNTYAGVPEIGDLPTAFALRQNRPNPFSTATVVAFDLPEDTNARISIYDAHGRLIRNIIDTDYEAGRHAVTWRGEDETGRPVSPGVYFIRMEAGEFEEMKKVLLLR